MTLNYDMYICAMAQKVDTLKQFDSIIQECRTLFEKKTRDYGTSWRILRPSSLTDQLFIKAQRVRSIEEKGMQKVGDSIEDEYIGIVNYSILALVQLELSAEAPLELELHEVLKAYDKEANSVRSLLASKNHDYDEAWRKMRISSITDLILMKLLRIKSIEDNQGETIVSEGLDAGYKDIVNYAVFALIRLRENN